MKRIVNLALVLSLLVSMFASISVSAEAPTFTFTMTADKDVVKAGETVNFTVSVTEVTKIMGMKITLQWDKNYFEKIANKNLITVNSGVENPTLNVLVANKAVCSLASAMQCFADEALVVIPLVAKADINGETTVTLTVDAAGVSYSASGNVVDDEGNPDMVTGAVPTSSTLTVGVTVGEVAPPAFTVTANDNGTDTVVTVANKGDKTGKVYVATFVAGVLDVCQVKDLADGTLTFEGLTGDVKVYVWDANMVPLLDTALDA